MENTSKNNYAKTCVLNVTADVKDGKNYVSEFISLPLLKL